MKQEVTLTHSKDLKNKLTGAQLPAPAPEKEKMDKETAQILFDDRVATGG